MLPKIPLYKPNPPRIVCARVQFWGGLLRRPLARVNPGSGRYHFWPKWPSAVRACPLRGTTHLLHPLRIYY